MITRSATETKKIGEGIGKKIKKGAVVCLYGDLGAGKTTLIQGIAGGLGIKKRIISPTFVLVRNYGRVYHIDLYRVDDPKNLGLEDLWQDPANILLIEWPEKIAVSLPRQRREVKIEIVSETERKITDETLH